MSKKAVLILISVALIGSVALFVTTSNKKNNSITSNTKSTPSDKTPTKQPNTVEINNFKFEPGEMTVKKGTKVTWKNNDPTKHSVIFDDENNGKVEDSKLIGKGEEVSFTFNEIGKFTYHCQPHPYMKGTIIVTE